MIKHMKNSILIILTLLISFNVYSQSIDSLKFMARLNKIEKENIEMKAKIEAYNDNNSSILNTVSITLVVLIGIFGLVNISQLIQNHRMNNKKLTEIETRLSNEIDNVIESKIDTKVSSKFSEIAGLEKQILELKISSVQIKCPSISFQSIDSEIYNLSTLLGLSNKHYKKTGSDYYVSTALEGFIKHLKEQPVTDYEKEDIFKAIKDIDSHFDYKINNIRKLLKEK